MNRDTADPAVSLVDTMSPSKLDALERCPQAFAYRYVYGFRGPRRSSQGIGNAVDAAANAVYWRKLQSGETMPADEVAELFAAGWDKEAATIENWQDEQETPGQLLDVGTQAVKHWRDRIAVRVEPLAEPQVRLSFTARSPRPDLDELLGIEPRFEVRNVVDLLAVVPWGDGTTRRVLVDHKASGKLWNANDVLRSSQAPLYYLATGVASFQWHVLRTDTVKPRANVVSSQTTESQAEHLVRRMAMARRTIVAGYRSGDWETRRTGSLCTRRFCEHWERCERDNGGTVAA